MNESTNWTKIDKATWDKFHGSSAEELAKVYVSLRPTNEQEWKNAEAIYELGLHRFIRKNERRSDRQRLFRNFIVTAYNEQKGVGA